MGNKVGSTYFSTTSTDITQQIRGKTVCIDGAMYIYKYCAVYRTAYGELFHNHKDQVTSHIYGLFPFLAQLSSVAKEIIFVFEGRAPSYKLAERLKREVQKEDAKTKYIEAVKDGLDPATISNYKKQTFSITAEIIETCKQLLINMGISFVFADAEGEKCCESLAIHYNAYVISDDWDCLMLNIPNILRKVVCKNGLIYAQHIRKKQCLQVLGITEKQLRTMIISAGCDYTPGIPKVGPITAYKLIKENTMHIKYPLYYPLVVELQQKLAIPESKELEIMKHIQNPLALRQFLIYGCDIDHHFVYRYLQYLVN